MIRILLLVMGIAGSGLGPISQADQAMLESCNTAREVKYMSAAEKQVLMYLNLARAHPAEFLANYLPGAAQELGQTTSSAYKSLLADLAKAKPLDLLQPNADLQKIAAAQAQDMGSTGKTGHTSSSGKRFSERSSRIAGEKGENCDYGNESPLLIVCDLLIDDKVSSLGHRKNCLKPCYRQVGIAIRAHKKFKANCVMDFSQ
jgi:uncharacterized protein YkwD